MFNICKILLFIFLLFGCNPERVEKLGQSLETTANVLDVLTPVFNKLDEVIYDYEYKGEYKDGKRHGYGKYIWKDEKFKGTKYIGNWQQNQMHGKGTMFFGNGDRYVGDFKFDKYDGEGIYFYNNGRKQEGIWKDGFFQYPKKLDTNNLNQNVKTKTYDMGHGQKLTVDVSNHTHSHSKNTKVSEKEELEFLRFNLSYGHKCRKSFFNSNGFTVGTEDYKKCVLNKGNKN